MTLQDYLNAIVRWVPTVSSVATADQIAAINDARVELAAVADINSQIQNTSLVVNQGAYNFLTPTGATMTGVKKIWIYIGDIRYVIPRRTAGNYPLANYNGYPLYYYMATGVVNFWPAPSQAFSSDWEIDTIPADLVNTTDTESYVPAIFQRPLIKLISSYGALLDNKVSLAQVLRKDYEVMMSSLARGNF